MRPRIRPGRSRNPAASPDLRACWRASRLTAAIRKRPTRTCAASASDSAATASARRFLRRARRFILRGRSTRCWLSAGTHSGIERQAGSRRRSQAFSAGNPETRHQADYIAAHPLPASFAGTTYWGVHAFPATNSKGETRFIKFKVMPVGEEDQAGRERGHGEVRRPPVRRPRRPDRGPRHQIQRDGAARPSRRPRHGCHDPMARRGRARNVAAGNDRDHRRRSEIDASVFNPGKP